MWLHMHHFRMALLLFTATSYVAMYTAPWTPSTPLYHLTILATILYRTPDYIDEGLVSTYIYSKKFTIVNYKMDTSSF
jgi:hypothetical protein